MKGIKSYLAASIVLCFLVSMSYGVIWHAEQKTKVAKEAAEKEAAEKEAAEEAAQAAAEANPESTPQYQTGYEKGYEEGAKVANNEIGNYDGSKDDWRGYAYGFIAAATGTGYNIATTSLPETYNTDTSKAKYIQSYHKGYFQALAEISMFQNGKYASSRITPNGTKVYTMEDGSIAQVFPNGTWNLQNGNLQVSVSADGQTKLAGWVIADDGKGSKAWKYSNGTVSYLYADGSWCYKTSNNAWGFYNAGSKTAIYSTGAWEYVDNTNGHYAYGDPNGKVSHYLNGIACDSNWQVK